jgi:raffinose/stachyose/melibiose transport system substrate-binding protein
VDPKTSRRGFVSLALGAPIAGAALAACGSSGPSGAGGSGSGGGGGGGSAGYWFLSAQPQQAVREDTVKRFNSSGGGNITYTEFQNDAYKTKIKTAVGAGQGPAIIWGWGGGGLKEFVKAGQVLDLTDWFKSNPDQKTRRFPSSFQAATIKNKIYALPAETVTPIVFYYNKKVFEKAGVSEHATIGK